MEKQSYAPVNTQIAGNLILPNTSGDHVRSIKRAAPVAGVDLVNKDYVDTAVGAYLPLTGGTLSGILYCDGNVGGLGLDVLKSAFISINLEVGQDLTVDRNIIVGGTVDGIDIATDVAANNTHRADNSQAHSDYLLNTSDTGTGDYTLTGGSSDGTLTLGTYATGISAREYNLLINSNELGSIPNTITINNGRAQVSGKGNGFLFKGFGVDMGRFHSNWVDNNNETDSQIQFSTRSGDAFAARMTINKDKVGIGTATPDTELTVNGDFHLDGTGKKIIYASTNAGNRRRIFERATDDNLYFGDVDDTNADLNLRAGGSTVLVIKDGGNIEVSGNIIVTGTVDGVDIATDVAANTAKVSSVVTKVLIDTYEGNGSNNREINLGDDYDEIHIYLEENRAADVYHLSEAVAIGTYYSNRGNWVGNAWGDLTYSMGASDQYFQGKMTGGDVNKIKLGSVGTQLFGTNYNGFTYRIIAKKYASVESLP